jgi:hypothetical protein
MRADLNSPTHSNAPTTGHKKDMGRSPSGGGRTDKSRPWRKCSTCARSCKVRSSLPASNRRNVSPWRLQ